VGAISCKFKSCQPHQTIQIRTYPDRFLLLAKCSDLCFTLAKISSSISIEKPNHQSKVKIAVILHKSNGDFAFCVVSGQPVKIALSYFTHCVHLAKHVKKQSAEYLCEAD